ncbi:MAG TPA: hypothetical protein VHG90_13065 [Acidimicrobiales bacterium]|nr:hypothetical protein [Acidimicrobiales bacterium]
MAAGGVLAGVLLFVVVLNVMGSRGSGNLAGPDLFLVGKATPLAQTVAEKGPLLFPDPLGRGRDVYVNHLGGGDWRTFEVRPRGAPSRCVVRWRTERRLFVDDCTGREYPADGAGLVTYPTRVDDEGRVVVDLRHPQDPAVTSTTAG